MLMNWKGNLKIFMRWQNLPLLAHPRLFSLPVPSLLKATDIPTLLLGLTPWHYREPHRWLTFLHPLLSPLPLKLQTKYLSAGFARTGKSQRIYAPIARHRPTKKRFRFMSWAHRLDLNNQLLVTLVCETCLICDQGYLTDLDADIMVMSYYARQQFRTCILFEVDSFMVMYIAIFTVDSWRLFQKLFFCIQFPIWKHTCTARICFTVPTFIIFTSYLIVWSAGISLELHRNFRSILAAFSARSVFMIRTLWWSYWLGYWGSQSRVRN